MQEMEEIQVVEAQPDLVSDVVTEYQHYDASDDPPEDSNRRNRSKIENRTLEYRTEIKFIEIEVEPNLNRK